MQQNSIQRKISFADNQEAIAILGRNDENFRIIQKILPADLPAGEMKLLSVAARRK